MGYTMRRISVGRPMKSKKEFLGVISDILGPEDRQDAVRRAYDLRL